jgi:hypothetical protein
MPMSEPICPLCAEINHTENELREITLAIKRLQKQAAPIFKEYMANRSAHPKCANCTILTGKHHLEKNIVPEPMVPRAKGQRRYLVCDACYIDLHKAKMSVPQRKKYSLEVSAMIDQEIADEENESIEGSTEEE